MNNLPLEFKSLALAREPFQSPWEIASGQSQALCAIPSEFGGSGGAFSPEDFFLQALINCFIGTFKVYAKASRIGFSKVYVEGTLTVDKDSAGQIRMEKCRLDISIFDCDRPDRIESIVAKVFREGFILNSVKTKIEFNLLLQESQNGKTL